MAEVSVLQEHKTDRPCTQSTRFAHGADSRLDASIHAGDSRASRHPNADLPIRQPRNREGEGVWIRWG
jgi:hypothetical protein